MSLSRKLFIGFGLILALLGLYVLSAGRIVLNATNSLNGNAYAMVEWPKVAPRGAVVALELPEALRAQFGDEPFYLTKRVAGVAGDPVRSNERELCINARCVTAQVRNGQAVAQIWQGSEVPEGSILVLGDSPDSLDSRYAVIGPRPVSEIVAVGFAIPFPHWSELGEWLR